MDSLTSAAMTIAMVAAFLLFLGGVRLWLDRGTRGHGTLMIAAALVLVVNVAIWSA